MTRERFPDLRVHIVAPSSYEPYRLNEPVRQYGAVMMQSPILNILQGLSEKAADERNLKVTFAQYNERTEKGEGYISSIVNEKSLARKTVAFISAKSFELSRAIDIVLQLKQAGIPSIIGGPGINLADLKTYQYLIELGIPFHVGEVENVMGQIIEDAANGQLKPAYWQKGHPDISQAPLPKLSELSEHNQTLTHLAALEISRGCPFCCKFCCVVKEFGHEISERRSRSVDACVAYIAETYARGFSNIMLTDDNFRKSFTYPALKRPLMDLYEESRRKGRELSLFVQVDAKPDIVDEIDDLAAMGVKAVFSGFESDDPAVMILTNKRQNKPEKYPEIADKYHKNGIMVTGGVMIGFQNETPEGIRKSVSTLAGILDLGHPFIVTPLPGSDDYLDAIAKHQILTWDPNSFDSTLCVRGGHEHMTPEEVEKEYVQSYFRLFPEKDSGRLLLPLLGFEGGRQLPGRRLAEFGLKHFRRPWQLMMDGIPDLRRLTVKRSQDSFRGIPLEEADAQYCIEDSTDKAKYLSQIAWSPQEVIAA